MSEVITKYHTNYTGAEIKAIDVLRETDACVYLPSHRKPEGRRESKVGAYGQYHDTWADAHAYLIAKAQREVDSERLGLAAAEKKLSKVKGLSAPRGAK